MDHNLDTYKKWQPFLLGLCAAIGLFAGMNMRQAQQPNSKAKEQTNIPHNNVQKITDVLSYIQSKYVDSLDMEVSTDVALESLLACFCLLYTSDAADERSSVDLGGRRIIKKKNSKEFNDRKKI